MPSRKLLILIATLMLILPLLAACGEEERRGDTGGTPAQAANTPSGIGQGEATRPADGGTAQAGETPAADGGSQGGQASELSGEITVWGMGAEGEELQVLADDFMKEHPNLQVNTVPIAWDVAHDKLLTAVAGQETPCVSQMGTTWMGEFAETGALATVPDNIDKGAFFDSAWDTVVAADGKAYGVPWYVETRLLFYRTDIAKKAGIDEAPQNWDELKQMARAMKEEGGARYGIALSPNNWQEFLPFAWQNGGQVMTKDGEFALDSPEVTEALEYYQSFFKDGLTAQTVAQGFDVTQGFVAGTHPMFFSGPWHMGLIEEQGGEKMQGKWDVALMPEKESQTSFVGGSDLVVFENCENPEAAWAFVEYLSQPDVQVKWYETVKSLPAVKEAWESEQLSGDEQLAKFGEQLEAAQAPPVIPEWEEIASAINDEIEKATIGNATAQAAARAMQQQAESIAR